MSLEIGEYVLSGELDNTRRNSVYGYLQIAQDYVLHLQLTGNASPPLAGHRISFRATQPIQLAELKTDQPIGDDSQSKSSTDLNPSSDATGTEELSGTNSPLSEDAGESTTGDPTRSESSVSGSQPDRVDPREEQLPEWVRQISRRQAGVCASLEVEHRGEDILNVIIRIDWYSQNGHMLATFPANLIPTSEDEDDEEDGESENSLFGISEIVYEDPDAGLDGEIDDDEEPEDPFGLFNEQLNERIAESIGDLGDGGEYVDDPFSAGPWADWRNQENLDPETRELYAQWDEIFSGKKDQPLPYLFDKTLRLPKPEAVQSEEEAWPLVVSILEQLAKLSFVLDVCEHYSAVKTYALLLEEVLPNAQVHPNLAASEIVQHYSTSDFCPECEAEFDVDADETLGSD